MNSNCFVSGYELFGEERKTCEDGKSWDEEEELPHCSVNMARYTTLSLVFWSIAANLHCNLLHFWYAWLPCFRYKPTSASSETVGGSPSNAVDGVATTVHEGRKCTETKSEQSPWWTVDLLTVQVNCIMARTLDFRWKHSQALVNIHERASIQFVRCIWCNSQFQPVLKSIHKNLNPICNIIF